MKAKELESILLYENGAYDVRKAENGKGYEVYKAGTTHATRCAQIGWSGEIGLQKAIQEADRRAGLD